MGLYKYEDDHELGKEVDLMFGDEICSLRFQSNLTPHLTFNLTNRLMPTSILASAHEILFQLQFFFFIEATARP